jgi:hypothetical protein
MNGETWEALRRCQPWPTPHRVARAYRELYGTHPEGGYGRRAYRYSREEILAVAAYLLERQQKAEAASGCWLRQGVGR